MTGGGPNDHLRALMQARAAAVALAGRYPEVATVGSIVRQLDHLIARERGEAVDAARAGAIVIGVQAAREIEPLDLALADMLHAIAAREG